MDGRKTYAQRYISIYKKCNLASQMILYKEYYTIQVISMHHSSNCSLIIFIYQVILTAGSVYKTCTKWLENLIEKHSHLFMLTYS